MWNSLNPRIWSILMIVLTLVWVSSAQERKAPSNAPPLPHEWKEFLSSEGRFAISFPGKPREYVQPTDTKAGRLEKRIYALQTAHATYIVACDDLAPFSADPATIKQMLDHGRDQAIASEKGKLLEEKNISLDGHPGREIAVETPDGILKTRVYIVRQRLYQIILLTPGSQEHSKESAQSYESTARIFFDSFRLTIKPEGKRNQEPQQDHVLQQHYVLLPAQMRLLPARAGEVSRVEGEAWCRRSEDTEPEPLRLGAKLLAGDRVLTGAHGRVEWSLNPGAFFQVAPASEVRVSEVGLGRMHFDIERGEAFAVIDAFDPGVTLELDTPPAILTVLMRGRYRVRVAKDGATEAAVGSGELLFVDREGKKDSVTKGKRVRFAMSQTSR